MKSLLQFCILFCIVPILKAQSITDILQYDKRNNKKVQVHSTGKTLGASEICNNGIDDDGDGLIDLEDYSCYFSNSTPDVCIPSKMVWATFNSRLYWVDLVNNKDKVMDFPYSEFYGDITWAPNGKLYGPESYTGQIREINPSTAQTQLVGTITPGYNTSNGITADAQSNLYMCARITGTSNSWDVIKYNLATHNITLVASLASHGLISAGDLTFLNGFLYVACESSKIAKINTADGSMQVITYTGAGTTASFGLITLGDGYLYMSMADELYRLDPNTWVSTFYYKLPTYGYIFGLSSYSEFCEAPGCKAKVKISIESNPPFCSNTGVSLKANGLGINGANDYMWTLPDNSTITGNAITAFTSGKYFARYHTVPDTCGAVDSISINVTGFPHISLGNDTILCPASQLMLQPLNNEGIQSYVWQDGSINPNYFVTQTGVYWLDASNVCGTKRDSVIVTAGSPPMVNLGNDTLLCFQTSITLKNLAAKSPADIYEWPDGSAADKWIVQQPGTYWLKSKNTCGTARDSVVISLKDSCICSPFYAAVDLGPDAAICPGDTIVLINRVDKQGFKHRWQDGSTGTNYIVKQPGVYWVEVSTYCNRVRDTIIINPKSNCDCTVYFPAAFTPNNDGKNETFKPLCYCDISGELFIYNRYGNLIYHTTALQTGWNGIYQNIQQPMGAYTYYLLYKVKNRPAVFNQKGSFILLR